MRLLNIHTFQLHQYHASDVPKYVIASHRWMTGHEATFKDVQKQRNTDKPGYEKIRGFCQYIQTHVTGVDWLWIDTCCIDERSSQEVSEAINSMFKWYSNAEVCLAYLADVTAVGEGDLLNSDWFTRGWTLQEMLAPPLVVFLTRNWQIIGHKGQDRCRESRLLLDPGRSLEAAIASLTKIPEQVLQKYEESRHLSMDEKMRWTAGRVTSREEDISYCLFGIFDVAPGANYGEGAERARKRLLREISGHINTVEKETGTHETPQRLERDHDPVVSNEKGDESDITHQIVMDSLYFPQIEDRKNHIQGAYHGTYQWVLLSNTAESFGWDNFVAWLRDPQSPHRIYWINAKPGAGKSSLTRFLDEKILPHEHMQPWILHNQVLRARFYFWKPGDALQKSLEGFLRSVLHQFFSQLPELLWRCTPVEKVRLAQVQKKIDSSWNKFELQDCLRTFISLVASSAKILFIIDGLDEIDGSEDARDELVKVVLELANSSHVKLCVASRRWTVFEDAFAACPQLRLADLNSNDIETYVRGELEPQRRYQPMLDQDPTAGLLVVETINKAEGVFLWARLVVKELVRGIRDGDSLSKLLQKIRSIPGDLNDYFVQLMDSIEPQHRREACTILQLALHEESEFISLYHLRLLDLVFIDKAGTDFSLSKNSTLNNAFSSARSLVYKLDSTLALLSSRCKGLLECTFIPNASIEYENANFEAENIASRLPTFHSLTALPTELISVLHSHQFLLFSFEVHFMHRSLRDFLLETGPQGYLHRYTGGPFDSRNYLRNTRLIEVSFAINAQLPHSLTVGIASHLACALSVPDFREDPRCLAFAARLRSVVEYFVQTRLSHVAPYWFICRSLEAWHTEESNFLTFAIDFSLTSYVTQNLTAQAVQGKQGRPLLDYILRPRYTSFVGFQSICNQWPQPALVQQFLSLGADPNQEFEGVSIWPLFLVRVADYSSHGEVPKAMMSALTLVAEMMIRAGAKLSLTRSEALASSTHGTLCDDRFLASVNAGSQDAKPSSGRWPGLASKASLSNERDQSFALWDVLECLRHRLGSEIDSLQAVARQQIQFPKTYSYATQLAPAPLANLGHSGRPNRPP